jgi:hypothetical protein
MTTSKSLLLFIAFFLMTLSVGAEHPKNGGPFGLGFQVGAPIGVTAKYFISREDAFQGTFGFRSERAIISADYLWYPGEFAVQEGQMPYYIGAGPRLHFKRHDNTFGVRLVVGTAYHFPNDPFEAFIELAPVLRLAPSAGSDFDAVLGIRYYFRGTR